MTRDQIDTSGQTRNSDRAVWSDAMVVWRTQTVRRIGLYLVFVVAAILAFLILPYIQNDPLNRHDYSSGLDYLVARTISAPRDFMDLALRGAILIAFGVGFINIACTLPRLIAGPQKAATTAEATIEQFVESAITCAGTLDRAKVRADAAFLLTPAAYSAVGRWEGFLQHWNKCNEEILGKLVELSAPKPVTQTRVATPTSHIDHHGDGTCTAVITVPITVISGVDNPGLSKSQTLGPWHFRTDVRLREMDGRWHLESPTPSLICQIASG